MISGHRLKTYLPIIEKLVKYKEQLLPVLHSPKVQNLVLVNKIALMPEQSAGPIRAGSAKTLPPKSFQLVPVPVPYNYFVC